ncbi:MAG: methyltransferase domain-containing protein [Candidatus Acidiferrum sp.]
MSLQEEYDAWHKRIFEADPEHEDASSPWYQLVRERIGPVVGKQILEVACGRGGFSNELARAGARVIGCDFSFEAVRMADARLHSANERASSGFVLGDAQNLPFVDNSFDLVISCETIEHVPDASKALREMLRVCRPEGKLFLTTPNYANFMGLYEIYSWFRHPARKDDQPFDRRQWFLQIRRLVRSAGWVILWTDGTVHQFPFLPGHNPIRWKGLESNRTIRKLLSPMALTYFVIAKKKGVR